MSAGGRGCGRVCGVIARRINRASADTHPENSTNPVICCCVWLRITARQSLRNFRNYMHCKHTGVGGAVPRFAEEMRVELILSGVVAQSQMFVRSRCDFWMDTIKPAELMFPAVGVSQFCQSRGWPFCHEEIAWY